jgi:hypothetical protein
MTRQHFNMIADVIRTTELTAGHGEHASCEIAREQMARAMADALYATNGRFDRGRFMRACGVER